LSHTIPSRDFEQVLERALDALIRQEEKRKFGDAAKPRRQGGSSENPRYIPREIRRAVWERDEGQCTFIGETGHRCGSRWLIQYDHIEPVARGGRVTVDSVRLLCAAHNQLEAERAFGADFVQKKREANRRARSNARARVPSDSSAARTSGGVAGAHAEPGPHDDAKQRVQDILAGLLHLRCRPDLARRAAEYAGTLSNATLEEAMRAALEFAAPRTGVRRISIAPVSTDV
jgi:5-methylcytosine-specific restriction endonuclease McrA